MHGAFTLEEILSQPDAWAASLAYLAEHQASIAALDPSAFDEVLFTGCGSTYYLAEAAAALYRSLTGGRARGLPASELWLSPEAAYAARGTTLLVAVSRSGTTTETLRAVQAFRAQGRGRVLTLSCTPGAALAAAGDLNLVLEAGLERSVAQTRAFTSLYLATVFLAQCWAGRDTSALEPLPHACRRLLERYAPLAAQHGEDLAVDRFYLLGSGARYGLACELSLKLKEMTLSHSEPFHFLEFRHGPQSMVTDTTCLVGLVSEANGGRERAVLQEMRARGARTLSIAVSEADVVLGGELPESLRGPLLLPVVQLLAFRRARAKGLDPDRPHNLEAVVMLD